ncbi:MAG: hypothetical protein SR1Q5_10705 [Quinella sp. 1Q5]|nr:hypothetical protein [Quinella sp. 1Q5]
MKKTFALLMLAAMLLSVGCGNQAQDAAKDAQQKVEQTADAAKDKANEVKDDAAKKVDEAKDVANQAADDAAKKVDEMKSDAATKADKMKSNVENALAVEGRTVALSGIMPGVSVEEVQSILGEATKVEGNEMTFVDGLKVVFDGAKKVKSISTIVDAFETPEGMYVGASEYSLNDYCGPADSVRKITNGAEYEYNSGDKKSIVVYKAENGIITEIICSLK